MVRVNKKGWSKVRSNKVKKGRSKVRSIKVRLE